jgi:predicted RNA-binding Zn ribbon-like protein
LSRLAHVLPDWLEPVLAFINTVDVETGVDELAGGPAALRDWLAGRGLLGVETDAVAVSRADHRLAIELRTGLRALALCNNGGQLDETALAMMSRAFDRFPLVAPVPPLVAAMPQAGPALRPHRLPPVRAALGAIVAGYAQAVATEDWVRIRRCPADDCAWAFWDSSAKGARRWCNMKVCGNRAKVRAFAQRNAESHPAESAHG